MTSCSWLLRRNTPLQIDVSLPVLNELTGGLYPGTLLELCGAAGVGKTQICYQLIRDCLRSNKKCVVVSNRTLCKARLNTLPNRDKLSVCYVNDVFELLVSLSVLETSVEAPSLVVVLGVHSLLQAVLGAANFRGLALLNDLKSGLGELARKAVVVYTNVIVSIGDGNHGPALGVSWESAPSVRVMLATQGEGTVLWRNKDRVAVMGYNDSNVSIVWK